MAARRLKLRAIDIEQSGDLLNGKGPEPLSFIRGILDLYCCALYMSKHIRNMPISCGVFVSQGCTLSRTNYERRYNADGTARKEVSGCIHFPVT